MLFLDNLRPHIGGAVATLLRIVVIVVMVAHVSAGRAWSDPVRVIAGSLSIDTGDPPSFRLFTADGRTYEGEGFATHWDPSCVYRCAAGSTIGLSMAPAGPDGYGFLGRDDGVSGYPVIRLDLSAPAVTLDPDTGLPRTKTFQVPFTFAGQLTAFPTPALSGEALFDVTLTGRGTASLNMFVEDGLYSFEWLDYDFEAGAPVPEPVSILLVGTGGALLWRRCRKAQQ